MLDPLELQEWQNFFKHLWRIWSYRYMDQLFLSIGVSWEFGFFIFFTVLRRARIYGILQSKHFPPWEKTVARLCWVQQSSRIGKTEASSPRHPSEKSGHWICVPNPCLPSVKIGARKYFAGHMVLRLGQGLWWEVSPDLPVVFDDESGFIFFWSARAFLTVSGIFTNGICLWIFAELVCLWVRRGSVLPSRLSCWCYYH